jgi:putative flippase GtrA
VTAVLQRFSGAEGRQFLRYLLVGGWNTAFGYATYAGFTWALTGRVRYAYMIAYAIASVLAISSAFLLYKLFVFRTRGNALREFLRMNAVYGATTLLGFGLLPLMVHAAGVMVDESWAPYVGQAIVVPITALAGFVGHRRFSFRGPPGNGARGAQP